MSHAKFHLNLIKESFYALRRQTEGNDEKMLLVLKGSSLEFTT
jgi:hypothetical protein